MSDHKCAGLVWGHMTYYRCNKIGRHEHEGKWYCKIHHPPTKQAKQQAQNEKSKAEFDAQVRAREQARLAQDEMKRKAAAYDGLVAERDAAVAALEIIAGVRPCLDNLMSDKDIARAAIDAVRGET